MALRISFPVGIVAAALVFALIGSLFLTQGAAAQPVPSGAFPWVRLTLALLVVVIAPMWIAVGWHRYVLNGETHSGIFPALRPRRLLSYFGRSLLISLISVLVGALIGGVAGFVIGVLGNTTGTETAGLSALVGGVLSASVIVPVIYRLSVLLPAAALSNPLQIKEAWDSTRGTTWTMVLLALLSFAGAFALGLPASLMPEHWVLPWLVVTAIATWINLMVAISILTTLYGHYVEKRPLL